MFTLRVWKNVVLIVLFIIGINRKSLLTVFYVCIILIICFVNILFQFVALPKLFIVGLLTRLFVCMLTRLQDCKIARLLEFMLSIYHILKPTINLYRFIVY